MRSATRRCLSESVKGDIRHPLQEQTTNLRVSQTLPSFPNNADFSLLTLGWFVRVTRIVALANALASVFTFLISSLIRVELGQLSARQLQLIRENVKLALRQIFPSADFHITG